MDKLFALSQYGNHLWTRTLAQKIRLDIEELLWSIDIGTAVVIDAEGVEVFDYSFANEFFAKLMHRLPVEFPGRFVVVSHLTPYARENLEQALESLNLLMIERHGTSVQLLGKTHPTDIDTFNAIWKAKGAVTVAELSNQLGLSATAINERVSKLTRLGVVRREKAVSDAGRGQFEYRVLT